MYAVQCVQLLKYHLKVAVKIFNADGSSKTIVIEEGMTAAIVCHMLIVKSNCQESPKWALIEKWEELGIGMIYKCF